MLLRQRVDKEEQLYEHIVRFFPAGTYNWVVPAGCFSVEVFLVGGGGGGGRIVGGGSGYTKAYRGTGYTGSGWQTDADGGRDGNAISVTPGQVIPITVGAGGNGCTRTSSAFVAGVNGGWSQFLNTSYRATGGIGGVIGASIISDPGGNGGSGGAGINGSGLSYGGTDGGNGQSLGGTGQGRTTRDFGEFAGKRNAGGGGGGADFSSSPDPNTALNNGGASDYNDGNGNDGIIIQPDGSNRFARTGGGGKGYGGGGGGGSKYNTDTGAIIGGKGGDGTVLLRFLSTTQP